MAWSSPAMTEVEGSTAAKEMQKACDGVVPGWAEHKNVWGFVGLPLESP
jgi:hypothetical protein